MRLGPASSKIGCDRGSEVYYPAAHRLIGDHDSAFSQQVLDIAEAEGKPGIEPDGLLDDHGWEAISGVTDLDDGHLWPQITVGKPNNVTMPSRTRRTRTHCGRARFRRCGSARARSAGSPRTDRARPPRDCDRPPAGQDFSSRSFARFGIWNSGRPHSRQTSRAFIITSFGGSENGPESIFWVASRTSLEP